MLPCETLTHGEYYNLKWPINTLRTKETFIKPINARSLVVSVRNKTVPFRRFIYVTGGFDVKMKGHRIVIHNIHMFLLIYLYLVKIWLFSYR